MVRFDLCVSLRSDAGGGCLPKLRVSRAPATIRRGKQVRSLVPLAAHRVKVTASGEREIEYKKAGASVSPSQTRSRLYGTCPSVLSLSDLSAAQ